MKPLLILIILIASTSGHAQDVYNFYFQKNQGTNSDVTPTPVSAPGVMAPQIVQADLKTVTEDKKSELKKWELGFYNSWVSVREDVRPAEAGHYDDQIAQRGLSLVGAYRFNKFFATEAGALLRTGWTYHQNSSNSLESFDSGKGLEGLLGLVIAPVHINLFGYEFIELALTGGAMSMTKYTSKWDKNFEHLESKKAKIIAPYAGPRLSVNLTNELAAILDVKSTMKQNGQMINVGLRWRF